nr:hypothetical protein BaRGS_027055 [Batillaria attramentaria]
MVDIMKYDTNRITETEADLFEEAAVALLNYTDHIAEVTLIALATLADIVTDEEAERLATSPDLAQFLLTILKKSLTSHQHTYGGWRVAELVRAVCHLARNDANKLLLVEQGALPLLVDGIKSQLKDEKDGSMEAVWALSLHKDNSQSFLQNETLLDLVVEVHKDKSQSDTCRRAAEGILWQLRHELEKVEKYATVAQQFTRNSSAKSKSGHVMLSYQWAHQPLVKRLHDLLEQQGIRVWMDIHKMGCSTRQSMAEAVEKAYIVLCCMSAKYKDSLPCRQEAEYADDLRKTIIPLKMERDYKADGWLGLMVAGKLFYDFSGKYPFDTKFQELVKAVREAGARVFLQHAED